MKTDIFLVNIFLGVYKDLLNQWSAAAYLVSIGNSSAHPLLAHV